MASSSSHLTVVNARRRFERVLAGWASDLLLMSRSRAHQRGAFGIGASDQTLTHLDSSW